MVAELFIAKELGMTLVQLRENMTEEELILWHAFFTLQREDEQKAMDKARKSRR